MPYVERDPNTHAIIGIYNLPQPGIAEEYLPDNNPEVQMFLHPQKVLIPTSDFVARFTNQEYLKLLQNRATDTTQAKIGNSRNWDIVVAADTVNVANQKSTTLKDGLVAAGVVTQARADEIFTA
jgi:hypothetical protein